MGTSDLTCHPLEHLLPGIRQICLPEETRETFRDMGIKERWENRSVFFQHPLYGAVITRKHLIDWLDAPITARHPSNQEIAKGFRGHSMKDVTWCGGTRQTLDDITRNGWADGAKRMQQAASKITNTPEPVTTRLLPRRHTEGDIILVDEYLKGNYETMWQQYHRAGGTGPGVIHLAFSWGGNCDLQADQLFWSGAVAMILTQLLELSGYSVEVVAWMPGWHYAREQFWSCIGVMVKEADQPLLYDSLAALSAHPVTFRMAGIAAIEMAPWCIGSGHGRHESGVKNLTTRLAHHAGWFEPPELVIESVYDEESARSELLRLLDRVECLRLYRLGYLREMPEDNMEKESLLVYHT